MTDEERIEVLTKRMQASADQLKVPIEECVAEHGSEAAARVLIAYGAALFWHASGGRDDAYDALCDGAWDEAQHAHKHATRTEVH